MKIFLDTASYAIIEQWVPTGLIDGVTTNPTLLSKEKKENLRQLIERICTLLPDGHISVEVTEENARDVYEQARKLADIAHNVVVKIPCHAQYYSVIKQLVADGIKLNITLLFSLPQALFMSKLGVMYISPFVARLDDIEGDGIQLLMQIREMLDTYGYETQVLAASMRSVRHLHDALCAGADAATVSADILEKSVQHPLTDKGMALFASDWNNAGLKQFP